MVCLCLASLLLPIAHAQEQDKPLSGSGILYPGGFDLNTIGDIRGKIKDTTLPASGPVRLTLISDRETYIVLTSPQWFWKEVGAAIAEGTEVIVRGSKSLGTDGNLYIIAQEIQVPSLQKSFIFRSTSGSPLWSGARTGQTGTHGGGFGSSSRGSGGGASGTGRGRR
jgi:hypothetical protein